MSGLGVAGVGKSVNALFGVLRHFPANVAVGIVVIAKEAGAAVAIVHAGGHIAAIGGDLRAQRALLGHAVLLVHLTHAIGAAVQTVLAANALVLVDKHIARLGITVARAVGHTATH